MLNTNTLRQQFKAIRDKQKQSATIGQWILAAMVVVFGAGILAILVRVFCLELVNVSHQLRG